MNYLWVSLVIFLFVGCAQHNQDIFHSKDLPEPFKAKNGMPTVNSTPDTPYQALDWRLPD